MVPQLRNGHSHGLVHLNHPGNKLHELVRVVAGLFALNVRVPELVKSVDDNTFVVRVLNVCSDKWRMAGNHDEQNGAESKEVCSLRGVVLAVLYLRCHVAWGSFSGLCFGFCDRETKICKLDIEVRTEHHIFWFQVSMSFSLIVKIFQCVKQLEEIVPGDVFFEHS